MAIPLKLLLKGLYFIIQSMATLRFLKKVVVHNFITHFSFHHSFLDFFQETSHLCHRMMRYMGIVQCVIIPCLVPHVIEVVHTT